jgi:hypothetical protein
MRLLHNENANPVVVHFTVNAQQAKSALEFFIDKSPNKSFDFGFSDDQMLLSILINDHVFSIV